MPTWKERVKDFRTRFVKKIILPKTEKKVFEPPIPTLEVPEKPKPESKMDVNVNSLHKALKKTKKGTPTFV